jgi:hypothetical protein
VNVGSKVEENLILVCVYKLKILRQVILMPENLDWIWSSAI